MARDPNKPTRMDGILNNIPKILDELTYNRSEFDPRFHPGKTTEYRVKDPLEFRPNVAPTGTLQPVNPITLQDLVGRPFLTSMSDLTAAGGILEGIGDVPLAHPIRLTGGQDYMRENNQLWASGVSPIADLKTAGDELFNLYGQAPVHMPFQMAPTGGDFAHMTGQTMMSWAGRNMPANNRSQLNKKIELLIPDFVGVEDPYSLVQFGQVNDKGRKSIKSMMDTEFRNLGGISLPQARLAVSDQTQLLPNGGGVKNVGVMDLEGGILSGQGNATYPDAIAGSYLGTLDTDVTAMDLNPNRLARAVKKDGTFREGPPGIDYLSTRTSPGRAMQTGIFGGLITQDLVDEQGAKGKKVRSPIAVGLGALAGAVGMGYSGQEVEAGVVDTAKKVVAADAKTTQRANTVNTAKSAAAYLKNQGASGKSLDYGAGHGINAKAMGFDETFEPFAGEGFTPTYTSGQDIPRGSYGQIVSTNVLNVIPPTDVIDGQVFRPRDMAVLNIGDALQDGGMAVIQTRSASAVNELKKSKTATPQDESGAFVTSRGSYQKGFTRPELQEYVQGVLGDGFSVEIVPAKDISAGSAVKVVKLSRSPSAQVKDPSSRNLLAGGTSVALGTGLLGASEESDASIVGSLSKLGAGRQDLLGMAKKMSNEGMDRARIWQRTGWELGTDGQWKTELPNTKTKINIPQIEEGRQYYTGTIADIVDDPELLSQYEKGGRKPTVRDMDGEIEEYRSRGTYGPLGDIEFIVDRNMPADQGFHKEGHFNSNEEWSPEMIVISGKSSPAEQRATVLHELQHAIQDREGFASGGSARSFEKEERIRDAFYDGVGLTPAGSKRLQELEAKSNEVGQGSMSIKELNELERLKVEKQIADRFNAETVGEAGARSPYGMYRSLMGEVEARNVEYRDQTFADLGLRDTSPYYSEDAFEPTSQQIFRAGSDDELTNELALLDLPNFRSDASSLDDDFSRMQQTADGGIINQMMAQNARSQQLAKYGDALKSRREAIKLKDTTRKLLDVDRPGTLQLGTEFAMRGAEDLAKVIVGATGSLFSPDSGFYEKVSGSDSVFGKPSEAYEDVTGAIAAGLEKYVVPELKEAFAWKGDSGRSINDKVDKTVQDVVAAYTATPQSFQDSVTPRLPYAATLVLSAYGLGAGKAALQGGKRIVGEPGGPGILGRLNPLEGELVMPEGLPNSKPIGLLQ